MPEGTVEWFRQRRGFGCFVPEHARFAIPTGARAGFGSLNERQGLARDVTREQGRRFSLTPTCDPSTRPASPSSAMSWANTVDRWSAPSVCLLSHNQPENDRWFEYARL
jgi:cold shock CspA family protein